MQSLPVDAKLKFFYAEMLYFGGFAYFEATNTSLTMRFIDGVGNVRYEYEMVPRRPRR